MKRGDVFTAATGGGFGGKPRPVLVLQADRFCAAPRIIVALIGSRTENVAILRVRVDPTPANGLRLPSEVQCDILMTVRARDFDQHCGALDLQDMQRVEAVLLELLGFG